MLMSTRLEIIEFAPSCLVTSHCWDIWTICPSSDDQSSLLCCDRCKKSNTIIFSIAYHKRTKIKFRNLLSMIWIISYFRPSVWCNVVSFRLLRTWSVWTNSKWRSLIICQGYHRMFMNWICMTVEYKSVIAEIFMLY